MPVILGPTACGKTAVAARLAFELDGEVISADSRQVYRGMDIGSGKDLSDYTIEGRNIPYHLIDIAEPGSEYNIFQYQKDFSEAYNDIVSRGKLPILCGGSGMYLESVIKGYSLPEAPAYPGFVSSMESLSDADLRQELSRLKKLHGTTDTSVRERILRALEIELKRQQDAGCKMQDAGCKIQDAGCKIQDSGCKMQDQSPLILHPASCILFGLNPGREIVRQRITARLHARLDCGMINEVSSLLEKGIPSKRLKAYGLEYKYLTQYLEGELSYDEMFRLLNTAIHQFAKRQMTWFRRMEKQGMKIHWIESNPISDIRYQISAICHLI